MKKPRKKKYAGGSFIEGMLPAEDATSVQAAGQFMALQQLYDQGLNSVDAIGNDMLANKIGAEEADIANSFSNKVGKIPIVGKQIGAIGNTVNLLSGKTGRKIRDFRKNESMNLVNNFQNANDLSGYVDQSKVTFAHGGDLQEFVGPTHEEGGIELTPEAEVEGGETKKGNYIFSDRLKVPGKKLTFAEVSKSIKGRYTGKRPNDPIDMKAEERELATLQDMQETVRGEIMSNAYTKAYGGFLKKKKLAFGGPENDPLTRYESMYDNKIDRINPINFLEYNDPSIVGNIENLVPTDMQPVLPVPNRGAMYAVSQSIPKLNSKQIPDILPSTLKTDTELTNNVIQPLSDTEFSKNGDIFGMQPMDYASAGIQSLAGLSQLYYGLKGPDDVPNANFKLARPNKINMTPAKRLASQEIDTAFNAVDRDIRDNSGGNSGRYLSNRIASAIKRGRVKGENIAKLSQEEELQNTSIANNFNQFNTQVLNQEELANLAQEDKRIQEKDSARMAVTEGLNNIGQSVGTTIKDRKQYDFQKLAAKWTGTSTVKQDKFGNKYYITPKGNKYVDGSDVPEDLIN